MTDTDDAPAAYTLHRGHQPLLVSVPHAGTALPGALRARLQPRAASVEDTDWHLDRLYGFVRDLGASLIVPAYSRYVIDLNRPREDTPMYPGVNNTGLLPDRFFTGEPLYLAGLEPAPGEAAERVERYWQPYHDTLAGELTRLQAAHGHAVLFDAHSIKSELPWLFEGSLPHMSLGTANGRSCAPSLADALAGVLGAQSQYSHVVDGRFKGGFITRRYGRPEWGLHAVQIEMCWRCYLDESAPERWHPGRAAEVEPLLRGLVQAMIAWRP